MCGIIAKEWSMLTTVYTFKGFFKYSGGIIYWYIALFLLSGLFCWLILNPLF